MELHASSHAHDNHNDKHDATTNNHNKEQAAGKSNNKQKQVTTIVEGNTRDRQPLHPPTTGQNLPGSNHRHLGSLTLHPDAATGG